MDPIFQHVGPMPYPAIQTLFDGLLPPGMQWYWRADFLMTWDLNLAQGTRSLAQRYQRLFLKCTSTLLQAL